jgi:large subunit ribosomal protein L29
MAKPKKIESRSVEELKVMATDLDKEIYRLRNELALQRKLEKPHLLKLKRKEKARVLTALTQTLREQGVA